MKMMNFGNISTIQEANEFLAEKFRPWWEKNCARAPLTDVDVHRSADDLDLDAIFSEQVKKSVRRAYCFQHENIRYQIEAGDMTPQLFRKKITLEVRTDGSLMAS
ncbi:MAG: hypothetical protein LBR53_11325, partial [Deltaproteobacteria bacterium]|nr:hypothetical protein [Deltaproteobacteria bacterium]